MPNPIPSTRISLGPKIAFLADHAACAAHSDHMASPAFHRAAAAALLRYQYALGGPDPAIAAVTAYKLRGAQEFLDVLMNLGVPESPSAPLPDSNLVPPEIHLDGPR